NSKTWISSRHLPFGTFEEPAYPSSPPPNSSSSSPPSIRVMSYNVWFSETWYHERAFAFFRLISSQLPDFVLLQEVTPRCMRLLSEQGCDSQYTLSDHNGSTLGQYGVLLRALRTHTPLSLSYFTLPTGMGRSFLVGEF